MRAVDTNILARYYLRDDPAQARIAEAILAQGEVFVPKTVILELEWVLRSVAEQPAAAVSRCLVHLVSLPGVLIEGSDQVEIALAYYQRGMDFADALHLAASNACTELLTFDDRRFAGRARRLRLKPRVTVPGA